MEKGPLSKAGSFLCGDLHCRNDPIIAYDRGGKAFPKYGELGWSDDLCGGDDFNVLQGFDDFYLGNIEWGQWDSRGENSE